jgi:molybdopterin converting factor small subunit
MKIVVKAREDLKGYTKMIEEFDLETPDGATIEDVMDILNLPKREIRLIVLNGKAAKKEATLKDGDTVEFFPIICGG